MALTTLSLSNHAAAAKNFTLVSQGSTGGEYRDVTRALSQPLSVLFNYKIGAAGSKANDKLVVSIRDVGINSESGQSYVAQARLEVSVPRDSEYSATGCEDILAYLASLIGDADFRTEIADAMLPTTAQA